MQEAKPKHERALGFWMCTALVVGNMIGSGIFLLPASIAPYGLNSVIAWLLSAAGALFLAVLYAELGRAFPTACGPFDYTRSAFGELAGFLVAWGYWASICVGNAAIATGAVSYLSDIFPPLGTQPTSAIVTIGSIWVFTAINAWGTRTAGSVQTITTVLKVMPLIAIAGLGIWLLVGQDPVLQPALHAPVTFSMQAVTAAASLTLFALLGLESATVPAGKIENPEKTIPRVTIIGTFATAALYVLSCTTVLLLIPAAKLAVSHAPFADVAGMFWGKGAATSLALFAAISGFGALNGWILLQGELPFHMAKQGMFPRVFARESARRTPAVSLCIGSVLATILIGMNASKSMVNVFSFVILLSTTASLVLYLACALALIRMMRTGAFVASGGRAAWLTFVAVVSALYSLWAIAGAGLSVDPAMCHAQLVCWAPWESNPAILGIGLLVAGLPVYALMRLRRGAVVRAS